MTIPPSKPGTEAARALAARLTSMRAAAGLSGNALAKRMKVVQSRVWKIEHGDLLPTEDDIRAWANATGRDNITQELVAMLGRPAEQAFAVEFRRRGGAAAYQDRPRAIKDGRRGSASSGGCHPRVPATPDYARQAVQRAVRAAVLGQRSRRDRDTVDGRLRRQEVIYDPDERIQVVLGEGALRTLVVSPETLAVAQLGKLLSVARLPCVELGMIGLDQRMPTTRWASGCAGTN